MPADCSKGEVQRRRSKERSPAVVYDGHANKQKQKNDTTYELMKTILSLF